MVGTLPRMLAAVVVTGIALVAAHGSATAGGARSGPGVNVSASGNGRHGTFSPSLVTVNPGDTVTWTATSGDHTATSDGGSFDSDAIAADSAPHRFSYTFTAPGRYAYHCRVLPGMSGVVDVRERSGAPTTTEPPTTTTTAPLYRAG